MMCTSEVKLKLEYKRKFHESVTQEVLQLKKRLTHLEEETNMMKQEMFQERAERKALLNEVYRQLKLIREGGRSDGLSQILYDDWNPSVFIRGGLGPNSVVDPRPVETIMTSVLCVEYNK